VRRRNLHPLCAALMIAVPAFAQTVDEPFVSAGQVTVGGIATDTSGKDLSKFMEYKDLSNGVLSNIGIVGRDNKRWIDGYGENFGRDDMYLNIRGGIYDLFSARFYSNWIPHNLMFNGVTPFAGAGTSNLSATFPSPDPATWLPLNLGYERKDTGGAFEWKAQSPWYFRVDGNHVATSGTKVGSASNGTSPGNGFTDLVLPVQYTTDNVSGEFGYATSSMTLSANYLYSRFSNDNSTVTWNNPFFANGIDTTYLPPSNNYQRLSLNGTWRQLPWNSSLAVRYTWDQTKSDSPIGQSVLNGSGSSAFLPVLPSAGTFNGNEQRQTFTAGWTAYPSNKLETRLYYNWQQMRNKGTQVTFCASDASSCGGISQNHLWDYDKQNAGIEARYRVNRANRLTGGYDYNHITQNRFDFDDTSTNTLWAEWQNTSVDDLTAKVRYSYLDRRSNFLLGNVGVDANDPAYLQRFVRTFDLAPLTQNRVKVDLDWAAADSLGVGFEYLYKDNNYKTTMLGRNGDTRNEVYVNVSYGLPASWRVTLFGDYEAVSYDSSHRNVGVGSCDANTGPNCFDPGAPPSSSSYNWNATVKNNNWMIGVAGDLPVNEKFKLTGSIIYEQASGTSDMTSQNNFGNPLPLSNYPNTKITSVDVKGIYVFDKHWSATAGYAYQRYSYSDDQFNGYTNTIPFPGVTTNTSQSYLNGWNANIPYNANIFYLTATYVF
jgi:MtrB/PioB family decaheme-associated outer membrane protein